MTDIESKNILIAGCGDVGGGVGLSLAAAGHRVTGLRRDAASVPQGLTPFAADLGDPVSLAALAQQVFDLVVVATSAGAFTAEAYQRAYVDGLRHLLGSLEGRPAMLLVSSTGVYHQADGSWVDEDSPTEPAGFSGRALLAAEELLAGCAPAAYSIVRAAGIYGPGRERLLAEVRAGRGVAAEPVRYGNRIHRDDLVAALVFLGARLLEASPVEPLYIAVDSDPAPAHEVRRWLAEQLGVSLKEQAGDSPLMRGGNKRCSNRRLLATGFSLRYPSYRDGYGAMIAAPGRD